MAYNDIQYIESTDVVSSSVDIINSNFSNLKDAISSNKVSLAKYDEDIQNAIDKLRSDFDNIKCGLDKKINTQSTSIRELEAKVESVNGTVTSATITALAEDIDGVKTALINLQSKIEGGDESISTQLDLIAQKTDELETAVGTLESLITDSDGDEISAGIQTLSERITTLEGTLEQAKTSLWAKINEHTASLDLCVTKDENGVIESSAKLNANKIILEGNTMAFSGNQITIDTDNFKLTSDGTITAKNGNFTGVVNATSGSFNGSVTATEFNIAPSDGGSLTFKLWDSDDTSTYGSKYPVGTPVFIATDSSGKLYVVNMTELSSSSTTSSVYLEDAYYLSSSISATDLVNATYNKTILKCTNGSTTTYKIGSSTGTTASGKYVTILSKTSNFFMYMDDYYGPFVGCIAMIPGYTMQVYIFNGSSVTIKYMYIISKVTYTNNGGIYYLNASSSDYLYVSEITSMSGKTVFSLNDTPSSSISNLGTETWNAVTGTSSSSYTLYDSGYHPKSGS